MPHSSDEKKPQSALGWYYRRFRSMPWAEVPHRVVELFHRRTSKNALRTRRDAQVPEPVLRKPLPTLPLNLRPLPGALASDQLDSLASEIDALCAGKIRLLGMEWPSGRMTDWGIDPESENHWPWQRYTFDIPRRHGQGPGDIKFAWELSRLQHLQVLALGAHYLERDDARACCFDILENWLDNNPPYQGLGYVSGIELASRVISILFAVTYLGPESFEKGLSRKVWRSLITHARFIARFPSLHSSANNHLVAESAALVVLGSVIPEVSEARKWREVGWRRLLVEADRQVHSDGTGAEQSPTYLAYTLEWMLIARQVNALASKSTTTELDHALTRGAQGISAMADVAGNVPFFGDCDDGVVLRPRLEEADYLASLVCGVAVCLDAPEVAHPAFLPDLRCHVLSDRTIEKGRFKLESKTLPDGGYSIIRRDHHGAEIFLLFDHGPLGFAQTAAHGHADALAIWLHVDGSPILVDFGTYRYFADNGFRSWARSTAAHNTVEVSGASQSEMTGPFNWGKRAEARLLEGIADDNDYRCRASHSGYSADSGVIHERTLMVSDTGKIEIEDKLEGAGNKLIRLSFHFAPDIGIDRVDEQRSFLLTRNTQSVATFSSDCGHMDMQLVRQKGELRPGAGVVSEGYNHLTPTNSIVITGTCRLPTMFRSVFALATR